MRRNALILTIAVSVSHCHGGGGGSAPAIAPPVVIQSLGGVWRGTRPNGTEILVLISESGEFRVLDEFGNQGFGQGIVTNETDVSIDYDLAPPFDDTLIDGSTSASCSLTGTIDERRTFEYDLTCTTSLDGSFGGHISLTYDPIYELDSSIARIVGSYDNLGEVLVIDANGSLFEQSAATGCVLNGAVAPIDSDWNLYEVTFTTESCGSFYAPLAGAEWSGLATLLNDQGVDIIVGAFITEVDGQFVSLVAALQEI